MSQPTWFEVLGDDAAAKEMEVLDYLAAMGYIPGYVGLPKASGSLAERGLIEKNWDWPADSNRFSLTLEGCNTLRVMSHRYLMPLWDEDLAPPRPFNGNLDGVCGLSGEENRMLLYLDYPAYTRDSPNAGALRHSLETKRLIELSIESITRSIRNFRCGGPAAGPWGRTLEGRVVLRYILKALHWKEENIPK